MTLRGGMGRILAVAALAVALVIFLASTGPTLDNQVSGPLRRDGGVCLSLEKWGVFGWREVGQTRSVADIQNGKWHSPVAEPACDVVPEQIYLIRPPFDAADGSYRICGMIDLNPCVEFEKIEFVNDEPGP